MVSDLSFMVGRRSASDRSITGAEPAIRDT